MLICIVTAGKRNNGNNSTPDKKREARERYIVRDWVSNGISVDG